jgi:hypothetical protein
MSARRSTYRVTAWNEKSQYWAVTVESHEEWGEATAWRTDQVKDRAVELIAKHTGKAPEQIVVIVQHKIGRRR